MKDYIIIGVVFCIACIMSLLPKAIYKYIANIFSMHKYGIRKQQRYRTYTETFGNLMIGISLFFCVIYCFLPFYNGIYFILFIFSYLCMLSQTYLVTRKKSNSIFRTVLILVNLFSAVCILGATGYFNQHAYVSVLNQFLIDFKAGQVFDVLYLLKNRTWMYYLFQGVIFAFPLVIMWNQFKYMRLENSVKAIYFGTYIIKMLFMICFFVLLTTKMFVFLDFVYQVEALKKSSLS